MVKKIYSQNRYVANLFFAMLVLILFMQATYAQESNQIGKILDSEGKPVPGAIINVSETNRLTISDKNGDFVLPKTKSGNELIITAVGFITANVFSHPEELLIVKLSNDEGKYNQLVDLPYQKVKSKLNMASISTMSGTELEKHPVTVLQNAFPGSLTGIAHYEFNSEPGFSQTKIYLRGLRSYLNTANAPDARYTVSAPIFIVDGIERDISFLDAFPIDNVTILKDAGSTAIYGMRGANGAVVVTTRRGAPGKTRIAFTQEVGYQMLDGMPQNLDSYEYATAVTRAQILDGRARTYSDEQINGFKRAVEGTLTPAEEWKYPNTNYRKEILRDYSPMYRTNLTLSGGNQTTRYFVTFSYLRQEGVYNTKWTEWKDTEIKSTQHVLNRYNLRTNIDFDITDKLSVSIDLGGRLDDVKQPNSSTNSIFTWAAEWHPDGLILNPNGTFFQFAYTGNPNPAGLIAMRGLDQNRTRKLYSNVKATYKLDAITTGLSISALAAFDAHNMLRLQQSQNFDAFYYDPWTGLGTDGLPTSYVRRITYSPLSNYSLSPREMNYRINTVFSLDYARIFAKKHAVTGFLQARTFKRVEPGFASSIRYASFNAMANYVYNDKLSIQGVVSYMGSDNYEKGNRFGFFPATTIGYVVSEEPFIKKLKVVDLLKVRVSYGRAGQNYLDGNTADGLSSYTTGRYPYQSTFSNTSSNYNYKFGTAQATYEGVRETAAGSKGIKWELSDMLNGGLDFDLFQGKLYGSFDAFKEWRSQIRVTRSTIPNVFGLSIPQDSYGKVETYGFESILGTNLRFGEIGMNFQGNFTFNRSKIIDVDEVEPLYDYQSIKGRRLGQRLAYVFEKFFETDEEIANSAYQGPSVKPGNAKFKDINKDGVIDQFDRLPLWNSNIPEIVVGFNLGFNWKGFDTRVLIVGFLNRTVYYRENIDHGFFWNGSATKEVYRTWGFYSDDPADPRNINARYPRLSMLGQDNDRSYPRNESTLWMDNGNYFQLKNIELAYTIPQRLTTKVGMEKVRIYTSAYNIFTFGAVTPKPLDPESPMNFLWNYPKTKNFSFGLNLVF